MFHWLFYACPRNHLGSFCMALPVCIMFLFLCFIETLPLQQKYRELSFHLFFASKIVHPRCDALHGNVILFYCQLLLHSRTYISKIMKWLNLKMQENAASSVSFFLSPSSETCETRKTPRAGETQETRDYYQIQRERSFTV